MKRVKAESLKKTRPFFGGGVDNHQTNYGMNSGPGLYGGIIQKRYLFYVCFVLVPGQGTAQKTGMGT